MDLDRICLLQFYSEVTGFDWIRARDVECRCMLIWNEKSKVTRCDCSLWDTLSHWNTISDKFKPLKFNVWLEDLELYQQEKEK